MSGSTPEQKDGIGKLNRKSAQDIKDADEKRKAELLADALIKTNAIMEKWTIRIGWMTIVMTIATLINLYISWK